MQKLLKYFLSICECHMLDMIKFQIEVGSILKRLPAANAITGTMIILIGMIPATPQTSFSVDRVANFLYNRDLLVT